MSEETMIKHKHIRADRIGLLVSGICLVHCFGTVGILTFLPLFSVFTPIDHWIHIILAFILIPIAIYAVTSGFRHHNKWPVPVLAGTGALSVLFGATLPLLEPMHQHHPPTLGHPEIFLTVIGSGLLLAGHALNIWYCHQSPENSSNHCKVSH